MFGNLNQYGKNAAQRLHTKANEAFGEVKDSINLIVDKDSLAAAKKGLRYVQLYSIISEVNGIGILEKLRSNTGLCDPEDQREYDKKRQEIFDEVRQRLLDAGDDDLEFETFRWVMKKLINSDKQKGVTSDFFDKATTALDLANNNRNNAPQQHADNDNEETSPKSPNFDNPEDRAAYKKAYENTKRHLMDKIL